MQESRNQDASAPPQSGICPGAYAHPGRLELGQRIQNKPGKERCTEELEALHKA